MSRDTNFYYSFLVLSPEKRRAIVAVWDFCRAVDDAVDDPGRGVSLDSVAFNVSRWKSELDCCFGRATPATEQARKLKPVIAHFDLPRQPFDDLLKGVEMDVTQQRYKTFNDLHEYCLRVASTVGLICVEIFGYRNEAVKDYAVVLGVALQLTNIIRDVSTDFRNGRIYLPQEDLERFNVAEADFKNGTSRQMEALLAFQCERARSFYVKSKQLLPLEDARRLVAAEIMSGIYFAILRRIEHRRHDVFSEIVRVPRWRRALIAIAVWTRVMLGWSVR